MAEVTVHLDPNEIAFSYRKLSPVFSGCGRSLQATLVDIVEGRLAVESLPMIAVLALPSAPEAGAEKGTKAGKKKGGGGGKSRRARGGASDDDEEDGAGSGAPLNAAQRFRYFSMNNRRLWVLRRARAVGAITTVPCRLKPPDVCARLLNPGSKGSRTFRLDRVCDDAVLDEPRRPTRAPQEIQGQAAHAGKAERHGEAPAVDAPAGVAVAAARTCEGASEGTSKGAGDSAGGCRTRDSARHINVTVSGAGLAPAYGNPSADESITTSLGLRALAPSQMLLTPPPPPQLAAPEPTTAGAEREGAGGAGDSGPRVLSKKEQRKAAKASAKGR